MRNLIYIAIVLLVLFASCETIEDRNELGPAVTADQINLDVKGASAGSNRIIVENLTKQYGGCWNLIDRYSNQDKDTIDLAYLGKDTIKFAAITDGGIVNINKLYEITKIEYPPFPGWTYLAGSTAAGKTWVWDFNNPNLNGIGPWGMGSYLSNNLYPTSGLLSADGSDYAGAQFDEMSFNLRDNSGNYTFVSHNTGSIGMPAGTYTGTFKYGVTAAGKIMRADSTLWAIGKIKLAGPTSKDKYSVSLGYSTTEKNKIITDYWILSITEKELILAYVPKLSTLANDPVQIWVLKPKE
jgi:hypothetical protein